MAVVDVTVRVVVVEFVALFDIVAATAEKHGTHRNKTIGTLRIAKPQKS